MKKKKVINWQVKKDHKASHGNLNGNLKAEKYDQKGISDPTNISKCDFGTAHRNSNFFINYTVYLWTSKSKGYLRLEGMYL